MTPNEAIFDKTLSATEFRVYAALLSYAYGKKTDARPSQRELHLRTGIDREAIRGALRTLTAHGVIKPLGQGRGGRKEAYRVRELGTKPDGRTAQFEPQAEEQPDGTTARSPDGSTAMFDVKPDGVAAINNTGRENNHKNTLALGVISASDVTSSRDGLCGGHSAGSAADAEQDDAPSAELKLSPSYAKGNEEPEATLPATPGPQQLAARRPSRAEINAAFLAPDGHRVSDSFDDLECDVNTILAWVYGEPLTRRALEGLVATHGVRRCAMWIRWLPRKIADEYERKQRPVAKPSGVYIDALAGGWDVNPAWPEFDERRHVAAARVLFDKRRLQNAERTDVTDEPCAPEHIDELDEAFSSASEPTSPCEDAEFDF